MDHSTTRLLIVDFPHQDGNLIARGFCEEKVYYETSRIRRPTRRFERMKPTP